MARSRLSRIGWVVEKMEVGRIYTAKDIIAIFQIAVDEGDNEYPAISARTAKHILYGIERTRRYHSQMTLSGGRNGVILLSKKKTEKRTEAVLNFSAFDRACGKLCAFFKPLNYPNEKRAL
jgi:phage/plasmid-associated DNA primase